MPDPTDTRSEVLSAAFDKMSAPAEAPPAAPSPTPAAAGVTTPPPLGTSEAPKPALGATEKPRDESGRFAPKDKAIEKPAEVPSPKGPAGEAKAGAEAPPPPSAPAEAATPPPATPPARAPQSWKPAAREAFAKAPPEVQQEVIRREREIQAALQTTAADRKYAEEIRQTIQPYEAMLRSQGATPAQAVGTLLRSGYTLQHGTPQQKAQLAAQIITGYGVDIEQLAAALDGKATAPAQVDPRSIAQQVEAQIMQRLGSQAATQAAQRNQERLDKFAEAHEFFEDVRVKMADILAARGDTNPTDAALDDAYDLACRVHPDIGNVVKQREAAKAAETSQEATKRAQEAASSIKSTPAGAKAPPPADRREVLSRRFDELNR